MKFFCYLFFLLFLFPTASVSSTPTEGEIDWEKIGTELKKKEFIMEHAAQNILGNIDVWVSMKNEVDGASGIAWCIILGNKIPSQPVGVITVLAALPQNSWLVPSVCPRPFIEDTATDEEIALYNKNSIQVLESFTMVDSEKERIRKDCLANIKKIASYKK